MDLTVHLELWSFAGGVVTGLLLFPSLFWMFFN